MLTRTTMRLRGLRKLRSRAIAATAILFLCVGVECAQASSITDPSANPVADPRAVVISDQARFTVLTPRLIRMEWASDSKFEDRASLVFINRLMPVPAFKRSVQKGWLVIDTGKVVLRYKQKSGTFTAENLEVIFTFNGATFTWHPGVVDSGNLGGTRRTLDGVRG